MNRSAVSIVCESTFAQVTLRRITRTKQLESTVLVHLTSYQNQKGTNRNKITSGEIVRRGCGGG
jgi:hypothetical protein